MEQRTPLQQPIPVYILLRENTLALDLIGPAEVLRYANRLAEKEGRPALFDLRYISAESRIDTSIGLRLAGGLAWFWNLRGYWREARTWLDRATSSAWRLDILRTVARTASSPRNGRSRVRAS